MDTNLPKRKPNRLAEYRYDTPNAYFVTLCTHQRKHLFWEAVGASIARPQDVPLSGLGRIAEECILSISSHYPAVSVDNYVIMPNHVHLLLQIHSDPDGRPMVAPTVATVVQQLKGRVTKLAGMPLWQKGYYDHVVRGDADYQEIWEYIEGNPGKYTEDPLCSE